jgi:hypothetical protein
MNYLPQSRVSIFGIAALLGATLLLAFVAQPVTAQSGVNTIQTVSSGLPSQVFNGNASLITTGTVSFNFMGTGGNDTFNLTGGNASAVFLATGLLNNTFNIVTGNPGTNGTLGTNSTTFSLISGANSTFNIIQNNFNGSVSFSIIAGSNSFVNDTSVGPVFNTLFSINLGSNSTASLGSQFTGNETTINVVY